MPRQVVRQPIYVSMYLWALASALTCPAAATSAGAAVVLVGNDLRARGEKKLLLEVFGAEYRAYAARVWRFLPGIY